MAVVYITADESLIIPDQSNRPLHTYHNAIEQRIDVELHGLTGRENSIRRVVVSDELSQSNKADVESYLGTDLAPATHEINPS